MIYDLTIISFTRSLQNLIKILEKGAKHAEIKKFDVEVLLNSRLAPDQFNLIRQVQIACDTAKLGAARLTGKTAPVHDDKEKTLPELKSRIEQVIQFLNTLSKTDYVGVEEKKITTPRWEGKYLMGSDYVMSHVIPNFYFHITTAYAILRHNGVDIGKGDYLGELPFRQ